MKALALLVTCGLSALAAEPAWRIAGPSREQAIYAGQPAKVATLAMADGAEELEARFTIEVWQVGGEIAAPMFKEVGPRSIRLVPDMTNEVELPWTSPEVRARSRFALRFLGDDRRLLGSVVVTAYPTNLMGEFTDLLRMVNVSLVHPPESVRAWFASRLPAKSEDAGSAVAEKHRITLRWKQPADGGRATSTAVELAAGMSKDTKGSRALLSLDPQIFERLERDPEALLQLMSIFRRTVVPAVTNEAKPAHLPAHEY